MRFLTLLSFLVLITLQSVAQLDQNKLFYAQKAEKYRKMKNTGAFLAVTGGILAIVGVSMMLNSSTTTTYNYGQQAQTTTTGDPVTGALLWLGGVAGLGSGIPLWIVGAHSQRKYERFFENTAFRFNLNPLHAGLTLTYRF